MSRAACSTTRRTSIRPTRKSATTARRPPASRRCSRRARAGSHEVKGGFEYFVSTRVGGNSQTSTGYVFQTDYARRGQPARARRQRRADSAVHARHLPPADLDAAARRRIDITTASLFVDRPRWRRARLAFDLGLRFETRDQQRHRRSRRSTPTPSCRGSAPLRPDRRRQDDSPGHLRPLLRQIQRRPVLAEQRRVGNADRIIGSYTGPAGEGLDFAAGFRSGELHDHLSGTFPTANIFFADDLTSPLTQGVHAGARRAISASGAMGARDLRALAAPPTSSRTSSRSTAAARPSTRNGVNSAPSTTPSTATATWRGANTTRSTCSPAVAFSASLSVERPVDRPAQEPRQLRRRSGEQPGDSLADRRLPGDLRRVRNFPMGRVDDFQRHKVRVWATYSLDLAAVRPARHRAALPLQLGAHLQPCRGGGAAVPGSRAINPGYARLPSSQPLFFGERGSQAFAGLRAAGPRRRPTACRCGSRCAPG